MAFETLAQTLGVEVRFEKGDFRSALCRVNEEKVIIIQKDAEISKKIEVFAKEFSKLDLSGLYVVPAVQLLVEEQKWDKKSSAPLEEK